MTTDFQHDALPHQWVHPDTQVRINCEDMPVELLPADHAFQLGLTGLT